MAVASLQGIINRKSPELYVLSRKNTRPQFWLDLLAKDGRWLQGRERKPLPDLGALVKLAGKRLKGAVIWDPAVPASANVATTIAGVHDAVVLSPELAERYLGKWRLPVLKDLRGKFTGAETGSKKNDAYRWAIREYLAKGRCSSHLLCLFEDSFSTRARGDIGYVLTRDWAVKNRAFVFDLSPWGDEKPLRRSRPTARPGLGNLQADSGRNASPIRRKTDDRVDRLLRLFQIRQHARPQERARAGADGVGVGLADVALQLLPEHHLQRLLQPIAAQPGAAPAAQTASRREESSAREQDLHLHPHGGLRLGHAALRIPAEPLAQRRPRQDSAGVGHQSESARNLPGPDRLLLQHRHGGRHVHRRRQRRRLHESQIAFAKNTCRCS